MEKNNIQFRNFEIKSIEEDNGEMILTGYGAVFNIPDEPNYLDESDIIVKGAFKKTLNENKDRIAFCYQHDIYNPIGKILELKEDSFGLYIKVRISDAEDDIKTKINEKILKEMSIGFETIKAEVLVQEGKGDNKPTIRYIQEVKLWEVSLVTLARNKFAVLDEVKGIERKNIISDEFDKVIAIERNEQKKFNLLLLKSLTLSEPTESLENEADKSVLGQMKFN